MIDDKAVEVARSVRRIDYVNADEWYRAVLTAAQPFIQEGWQPPEGYVLVPKEPVAWGRWRPDFGWYDTTVSSTIAETWRHMGYEAVPLYALPTPPSPEPK